MAELSLKALTKVYPGKVTAVTNINVEIADGEFIVLVGPSGCGKSTLLRMIAGLETITEGELTIGSRVVNKIEPGERDIAMVFQNYALYPHMSVRQNMAYGLKNEGLPKDQIEDRIAEASQILQLEPYLDRRPRQLSGGQRQRVAMGRAIVRHPSVFLFDEPLSNLDAKLRTQLRSELKNLHKRLEGTFIYVTHDQVEAMSLADRVVVMNAGNVEQVGTPLEVYRQPESVFVAGFIGNPTMNLIEGRVSEGVLETASGRINLGRPDIPAGTYTIGIRPEDVHPARAEEARAVLRTDYIEQLGADTIVHGRLGEAGFILRQDGQFSLPESGEMAVSFDASAVHVFDGTSGRRVAF